MGLTKIGRGQHNDFYIDSATLKNFISRSHVEIYGKKNENGKVEFVLNDKGLNGTFINDIRVRFEKKLSRLSHITADTVDIDSHRQEQFLTIFSLNKKALYTFTAALTMSVVKKF